MQPTNETNKDKLDIRHWWLYVLKLEQDKYYVGITSQTPEKRFHEHLHGRKSYWTEKYPPIKIIDTKYLGDISIDDVKDYENRVTRRYIRRKGINNVRGGDLLSTDDYTIKFGYIWDKLGWETLVVIILLTSIIIYLGISLQLNN